MLSSLTDRTSALAVAPDPESCNPLSGITKEIDVNLAFKLPVAITKGVAVKEPILSKLVIVVKLLHPKNIEEILFTLDNWAAPGRVTVDNALQALNVLEKDVIAVDTVLGIVILLMLLHTLNVEPN